MTSRKKPGVAFWATVVVVVVIVANPVSFGPACWLTNRGYIDSTTSGRIYRPMLQLCVQKHARLGEILRWFALLDTWPNGYRDTPDGVMDSMLFGK